VLPEEALGFANNRAYGDAATDTAARTVATFGADVGADDDPSAVSVVATDGVAAVAGVGDEGVVLLLLLRGVTVILMVPLAGSRGVVEVASFLAGLVADVALGLRNLNGDALVDDGKGDGLANDDEVEDCCGRRPDTLITGFGTDDKYRYANDDTGIDGYAIHGIPIVLGVVHDPIQ